MFSIIYDLLIGGTTTEQRANIWRVLITLILTVHILFVCGWMPGLSSGFASTESVSQLQTTINVIKTNQLIEAIEKERRNVCKYLMEKNQAALDYSVRKRDDLLRKYKIATGIDAQSVTCIELGYPTSEQ